MPRRAPRVLCDTNVLVPWTTRHHLITATQEGLLVPYWSPWIIGELYRVLTWLWVERKGGGRQQQAQCSESSKKLMELLIPLFRVVDPKPPWDIPWPSLMDPWDQPIWAAAKAAKVKYVVSDNTADFPPADVRGKHIYEGIDAAMN